MVYCIKMCMGVYIFKHEYKQNKILILMIKQKCT